MIVMRLSDGLGNQLFQFAAGETLRVRTGADIRYLIDAFTSKNARVDRPLMLPALVDCGGDLLCPRSFRSRAGQVMHRLLTPPGTAVRHISSFCYLTRLQGYEPSFDQIRDHTCVQGYFQARQCVADGLAAVRARVRKCLGDLIVKAHERHQARYGGRRVVALHLRLGDYQRIGDGKEAIVPVERIRAVLREIDSNAVIVAFTDTPDILGVLHLGRPIDLFQGSNALDDFTGMIACDDFVIANSTFSWWASVLGDAPEKVTWAPRDWLRPRKVGSDIFNDIYLPEQRLY